MIAKGAGCKEFFTFATSVDGRNDSGKLIGNSLGLEVTEHDPTAYCSRNNLPEAEFVATGGGGGSVIFTALEYSALLEKYSSQVAMVGKHGSEPIIKGAPTWPHGIVLKPICFIFVREWDFWFSPCPQSDTRNMPLLQRIAQFRRQMRPYSLHREEYDRPIPRRIVEEAGVARELFGQSKKAASRSLKYCNPTAVVEPNRGP